MKNNVKAHEPHLALFVPDDDPLVFYGAIATFAQTHLKQKGTLYFEINQYLGTQMKMLLANKNFADIELKKDIFGNDRMLKGILL